MDYLVKVIRELKANRKEFACKIRMEYLESIDEVNHVLNIAMLDNGLAISNCTGKPQPIAKEIEETF